MVARILVAFSLLAACEKRSAKYCASHEEDLANCPQLDAPPPPVVMCMTNDDCAGTYCEVGANLCVECLDNTHCDTSERCDVDGTYTCRGCISDIDCIGGVCLPGGSCSTDDNVIYVSADGTDTAGCTYASPCATITHALDLLTDARRHIHLSGDLTQSATLKNVPVPVMIVAAPGTTLTGGSGDWVLKIEGSVVTAIGFEIICAADQDAFEILASSTTTLEALEISGCTRDAGVDIHTGVTKITRSNIHDNGAGGVKSDGSARVSIINNWIHHNGELGGAIGGLLIDTDANNAPSQRVEFNTIVDNLVAGLNCKEPFLAPNNIIGANGTLLANNLMGCEMGNSLVVTDLTPLAFTNSAMGDYHIAATSIARDAGTLSPGVDNDIDADIRPQGMAPDLGGDELEAP